MRRRALLGALGTGLTGFGGCQALSKPEETTTRTQTEPTSEPTTPTRTTQTPTRSTCDEPGGRRVELVETAAVEAEFSVAATMERERVTADATAHLRVSLTNEGPERAVDVREQDFCQLFNRYDRISDPQGLLLYRIGNEYERAGDCWTEPMRPTDPRTVVDVGCTVNVLATGETVTTTYEVWDDYAAEGYFPPGTYRFTRQLSLYEPTESGDPKRLDQQVDVGLDLRVSDSRG